MSHPFNLELPRLLPLAKKGDRDAQNEILKGHMGLVIANAQYFYHPEHQENFIQWQDLIQLGFLGIMRAIQLFNPMHPKKKATFATYATYWVRHTMRREIQNNGHHIHIPVNKQQLMGHIRRSRGKRLKLKYHRVEIPVSMEEPISLDFLHQQYDDKPGRRGMGQSHSFLRLPREQGLLSRLQHKFELEEYLRLLTPKEKLVIEKYFGVGNGASASTSQIAMQLNVSNQRIRHIRIKAFRKIKAFADSV